MQFNADEPAQLTRLTRTVSEAAIDATISKVFISYSWDSDAHKEWVRQLGERLVTNGVEVILDQWKLLPS